MDPLLESFLLRYPGREKQIKQLFNFLGYEDEPFPNSIYIHGGPSTGKTTILKDFLSKNQIDHIIVNLNECFTTRILLETILNSLLGKKISLELNTGYKCENIMEFTNILKRDGKDLKLSVIVLEKAEKLRQMDFNLLPFFLRLREISGMNLTVILISELVFQKYYNNKYLVEPLKIHFEQYTKDEILNILALEFNNLEDIDGLNGINLDFFKNYLNVFLSVFHRACRDLSELRYMAHLNFIKYCEPIRKGECNVNDSMALWRNIAPILKSSLEILYLRISLDDINKFSKDNLANSLELPFYAKYLLIAAFLASYNPAKDDKRLFMKHHGKKKKTLSDVRSKSKVSEQLNTQLGPKPFTLDRLLAIFYAILEDKVGFNNNLLVQVSSLVQLQLLTSLSDNFNLDGQKYRCNVNFDFIQTISKMVGFNIRKYLSDYSHV